MCVWVKNTHSLLERKIMHYSLCVCTWIKRPHCSTLSHVLTEGISLLISFSLPGIGLKMQPQLCKTWTNNLRIHCPCSCNLSDRLALQVFALAQCFGFFDFKMDLYPSLELIHQPWDSVSYSPPRLLTACWDTSQKSYIACWNSLGLLFYASLAKERTFLECIFRTTWCLN